MASARIELSLTETLHFQRLVQFVEDVDNFARLWALEDLEGLVEDVRADLLGIPRP